MKKIILIIPLLILSICMISMLKADTLTEPSDLKQALAVDFSNAIISGNNINVRHKPDASSKVLTKLKNKDKIRFIETAGEPVFAGKYFGIWLKIELPDKKYGYVFSSFVKANSGNIEPFHLFFDRFKRSWQRRNMKSISGNIKFPLILESSFEGEVETSSIEKKNFFNEAEIDEPFMYKMTFRKESEKVLTVMYGYEASQYTLYFSLIDGNWVLLKIRKTG